MAAISICCIHYYHQLHCVGNFFELCFVSVSRQIRELKVANTKPNQNKCYNFTGIYLFTWAFCWKIQCAPEYVNPGWFHFSLYAYGGRVCHGTVQLPTCYMCNGVCVCVCVCSMKIPCNFHYRHYHWTPGEMFNLLHTTFWKIEK